MWHIWVDNTEEEQDLLRMHSWNVECGMWNVRCILSIDARVLREKRLVIVAPNLSTELG